MNETKNEPLATTQQSQSKAETSPSQTASSTKDFGTYTFEGKEYPMGYCRGPKMCEEMEKHPGYDKWADARAERMRNSIAGYVDANLEAEQRGRPTDRQLAAENFERMVKLKESRLFEAKTAQNTEVPTTYIYEGQEYPMGYCRGPKMCEHMKTQPGYDEWYKKDAEAMWVSVEKAINKDLASEK